jgi:hypothetical protein
VSHHDLDHAITSRLREIVFRNLGAQEQPGDTTGCVKMSRSEPQWAAFAARILAEIKSLPEMPPNHENHDDEDQPK